MRVEYFNQGLHNFHPTFLTKLETLRSTKQIHKQKESLKNRFVEKKISIRDSTVAFFYTIAPDHVIAIFILTK